MIAAWEHALALRAKGVDVPAVTAWALLGSHDWNRMVTRFIGHYEPGVFDLRGLHYTVADELDASDALAERPWAILAALLAGKAVEELAAVCDAVDARGAFIHGPDQALPLGSGTPLAVRADPAFTVDGDGLVAYLLDAIDGGWEPGVDEDAPWSGYTAPR